MAVLYQVQQDVILVSMLHARIAIVGHYENDTSFSRVCVTQTVLADYWNIPILDMWNKTGFSQQLVPGSKSLWTQITVSINCNICIFC